MQSHRSIAGRSLVEGQARGPLLWTDVPLSFWGGIDPRTGNVVDVHHPLRGRNVAGKILALPDGRGSCTGSTVMLELLLGAHAPAALLLVEPDDILTLGVLVARELFDRSIPVVQLTASAFQELAQADSVALGAARDDGAAGNKADSISAFIQTHPAQWSPVEFSARDQALLAGEGGEAARVAMRIVARLAEITGARRLIDITRMHVDACIYTGPASLRFARHMRDLGARFAAPTTLNAISVDRCHWQEQGVPPDEGEPADALAQAYIDMGARVSYTCAPYHLPNPPELGEQIAWAESNAVAYANSALGARTAKYPDFLEVMAGIVGRAPEAGCHLDGPRQPTLRLRVTAPARAGLTEEFYAVVGYAAGMAAGRRVPLVEGLSPLQPNGDDLRAFCAAFATTSSAPMCHIAGVTPEARLGMIGEQYIRDTCDLGHVALSSAWKELNGAAALGDNAGNGVGEHEVDVEVDLVALGNPHFSADEFARLAELCRGKRRASGVALIVTTSRFVRDVARQAGDLQAVEDFGAQIVQDACWCMLREPIVPPGARVIVTSSAKYAHYAGGLVGGRTRLAGLADCVLAASTGKLSNGMPPWLEQIRTHVEY